MLVTSTTGATIGHSSPAVAARLLSVAATAGWTSTTNLCSSLRPSTGFFLKSSVLQVYTLLPSLPLMANSFPTPVIQPGRRMTSGWSSDSAARSGWRSLIRVLAWWTARSVQFRHWRRISALTSTSSLTRSLLARAHSRHGRPRCGRDDATTPWHRLVTHEQCQHRSCVR